MKNICHITLSEIEKVIALNDAIPRRAGPLISGSNEEKGMMKEILAGGPPERRALLDYLHSLSKQKINDLAAVMLWGRDAKEHIGSFEDTLEHCRAFSADESVSYISGKRLGLSKYLAEGAANLGIS